MAGNGSTQPAPGEARLIPLGSHAGSPPIPIKRPATLVGSRKDIARIHLESSTVSNAHAVIVLNDAGCYIHDLGSRTHVWVNGQKVVDADLKDGDALQIGRFKFSYQAPAGARGAMRPAPSAEIAVSTLTDPLPLDKRVIQIGRRRGSDLQFDDESVSNVHAILFSHNGKWCVRDINSRTGTWLGGKPIHQESLTEGTSLRIGPATIVYNEVASPAAIPSAAMPPVAAAAAVIAPVAEAKLPPQIAKPVEPEPEIDIEALALESLAPETDATDDEIAADLAGDNVDDDEPLELDLAPLDLPPRAEISQPPVVEDADEPDQTPTADVIRLEVEPEADATLDSVAPVEPEAVADTVAELAIEPTAPDAVSEESEEDALASLRRGWHGPRAAPEAETPEVETPEVETPEAETAAEETPVADAPLPLEDEPVQIDLEPEPEIDLPPAIAISPAIEFADEIELAAPSVEAPAAEEPVAEAPVVAEAVAEAPAAPALLPVEDVGDDDDAIDLPEAAPAPAAGALVEPELPLETDDAGLEPAADLVEPDAEPETVELEAVEPEAVEAEPVAELSELDTIELETESDARESSADELADESEDEIDLSPESAAAPSAEPTTETSAETAPVAETPVDAPVVPSFNEFAVLEAAEAVAAEPTTDPSVAASDAASDTLVTADLEEAAEAVIAHEASEGPAPLPDRIAASDASEALFDNILDVAEATEEPLDPIDDWLAEVEAATEPDAESGAATAQPPSASLDADTVVRDTAAAPAGVADEGAPEPVADLEGIDFSDLTIEDDAGETAQRAPVAPMGEAPAPQAPIVEPPSPVRAVELDLDVFGDAIDASPAAPLMNLADSVEGDEDFSPLDSASGASVEVIEETLPTPASAIHEFDTELADSLDLVDEADHVDLRDLDAEPEEDHASADTAMDVTPLTARTPEPSDEDDFEDETVDAEEVVARDDRPDPDDLSPPSEGRLSDLIPTHGPMVGGAFTPMSQTFMVGGSSLVELGPEELTPEPAGGARNEAPGTSQPGPARQNPPRIPPPFATPVADSPDRRRPLRVGFGGSAAPAPQGSPFAAPTRTIAEALVGRTGQRSVDVFANPSPTPEDLLLNEPHDAPAPSAAKPSGNGADKPAPTVFGGSAEERELLETADRFRPRGAIGALTDFSKYELPAQIKPEEDPVFVAKLRKSRLRRVLACVILMVPLIGGAVAGVYRFVPVTSRLDATITFNGLDQASLDKRREFKAIQNENLRSEGTLDEAVSELRANLSKGFLASRDSLFAVLSSDPKDRWPENNPNAMRLRVVSVDKEDDIVRLDALAKAMIKANDGRTKKAADLSSTLNNTQAMIQSRIIRRDALDDEIRQIQAFGDTVASEAELDQAKAVKLAKENELKAARTKRFDIESAILLLQKQAPQELAPSPVAAISEKDADLKTLNEQLASLQKENESARAKVAAESDKARKALDGVITELEKELESAQKLKNNPELEKYVTGAKTLFSKTRTLTDELLERQSTLFDRLNQLKAKTQERIEAQRREALANDVELKKMSSELAMLTRQKNAADAEGMQEEAKKVELTMKLLQTRIQGREEVLNNDPVAAQVIADLQALVEQTAKNIKDDRKHIDDTLTKAQEDFQNTTPAVEKMPAEQKALAEGIEKKLKAVNEARQGYSKSADAAEAEQAQREKVLKEKMASVQQAIFSRKQVVEALAQEEQAETAEANRKKRLEEKKTELAQAQEQEKVALAAFDEADKKIATMNDSRRTREENESKRDQKLADREQIDQEIQKLQQDLRHKQNELASLIVPDPDIQRQSYDDPDRRPLFMGAAAGAVFVLMLIPIVWNLRLISRDHHPRPVQASNSLASANGFEPVLADDEPTDAETPASPDDTEHPHEEDAPAAVR